MSFRTQNKMVYWKSLYESHEANAEIAASSSATYFTSNNDKQQLIKFGQSFNALEINNNDNSIVVNVYLDGLATRKRVLFAKSSLVIEPEEGIFFNSVKIENTDAANALAAAKIQLNARALIPQRG